MQKVDAQPQILIDRLVDVDTIKSALAAVFEIKGQNTFVSETPIDANWDQLLDNGYAVVRGFDDGDIKSRIDLFVRSDLMTDTNLFAFASGLGGPIIVDFSPSELSPLFIRYSTDGKQFEKIVEFQNVSGEICYRLFRPDQPV